MPNISVNVNTLAATGVLWQGRVDDIGTVLVDVNDNGGGSTITWEQSADNSSWSNMTQGYVLSSGTLTAIGGATTTAKGQYYFPVVNKYFRARVSTYVSGNVVVDVDYSVVPLAKNMQPISDLLTALGTTLATALQLIAYVNRISTAAASTGVSLPNNSFALGTEVKVRNDGANAITVYPATALGKINGGSAGAGVSVAAASSRIFVQTATADNWIAV
jgi:hypothetical protein